MSWQGSQRLQKYSLFTSKTKVKVLVAMTENLKFASVESLASY